MLNGSDLIAFAAATDLDRARAFYEGTLDLRLVEQNEFACVFDAHGTMLRVTQVSEVARYGYTVLGWRVGDIAKTIVGLRARGLEFTRHNGMYPNNNFPSTTPRTARRPCSQHPQPNTMRRP